ncbi:MAG: T9SS type A sorting domain-containing protein [Bacteroidota bacterium]
MLTKKIFTILAILLVGMLGLSAQHLCLSYEVKVNKNQAQVAVYMRSDTAGGSPLASYSTLLHFDGQKAEFNAIEYSTELWDATFADPNPVLHYGKGKSRKNAYLQIAAVDMQPSSQTQVNKTILLYTITFNTATGAKLKKDDFYLSFLHKPTSDLNYADYAGENFAISSCDYRSEKRQEKEEEEAFTLVPNPACGEVNVQLKEMSQLEIFYNIYDLNGKILQQGQFDEYTEIARLAVDQLSPGLYFLSLRIEEDVITQKLMIKDCNTPSTAPNTTPHNSSTIRSKS